MFEEVRPVGVPQLTVVVNDAAVLYELVPPEQTVCTWNWNVVPSVNPVKSVDVVVMPGTVVQLEEDDGFHWRL